MSSIFISHASCDKSRLVPYVLYILATTDSSVCLWIDQPEEMHPNFSRIKRIKAIIPGSDWREMVISACREANAIMVFWSARAAEKEREVLTQEMTIAIQEEKCVPICLDKREDSNLPQILKNQQVLEVFRFCELRDDAQFDRAIDRAAELANSPKDERKKRRAAFEQSPTSTSTPTQSRQTQIQSMSGDYIEGNKITYK